MNLSTLGAACLTGSLVNSVSDRFCSWSFKTKPPLNTPRYSCVQWELSATDIRYTLANPNTPKLNCIQCLFKNIVTFGLCGLVKRLEFERALLLRDLTTAQKIFQKGWIKSVNEDLLKKLRVQNNFTSLHWLIDKEFARIAALEAKEKSPYTLRAHRADTWSPKGFYYYKNWLEERDQIAGVGPLTVRIFGSELFSAAHLNGMLQHVPSHAKGDLLKMIAKSKSRDDSGDDIHYDCNEIKTLIAHGLDPKDAVTEVGIFSGQAHHIFMKPNPTTIRFYLDAGIDPNVRRNHYDFSQTLLYSVVISELYKANTVSPKTLQIVEMLLERGANPNALSKAVGKSHTVLELAIEKGQKPLVELLLKYKADPNVRGTESAHSAYEVALQSDFANANLIKSLQGAGGTTTREFLNAELEKTIKQTLSKEEGLEKLQLLQTLGAIAKDDVLKTALNNAIDLQLVEKAAFFKAFLEKKALFKAQFQVV